MKKTIVLLLLLLPFCFSFAQMIKGTVVNDAGMKIGNVNIYIDGTKTGTVSNEDGSFMLNISGNNLGNIIFRKEKGMKETKGERRKRNSHSPLFLLSFEPKFGSSGPVARGLNGFRQSPS